MRAWSPKFTYKAFSSDEYFQLSLYTDLENREGLLEDFEIGGLVEEWRYKGLSLRINYYIVDADVRSAASAPTLIETPRSIATRPPKEDSMFEKSIFGSPIVPFTGVTLALASKVNSSPADASRLAKTVACARPFRISTPISRRGMMWASTRPVNVAEAPTSSLMAIQSL